MQRKVRSDSPKPSRDWWKSERLCTEENDEYEAAKEVGWKMVDVVDRSVRSRMMAAVQSKDTKPEMTLRRALHKAGLRYRLHHSGLPGSPDLVFSRFRAVCFVHGCFWHRHAGCRYASSPGTRKDYWEAKFQANVERDRRTRQKLLESGWRVATVWECWLRHQPVDELAGEFRKWLEGAETQFETGLLVRQDKK